MKKTSWLLIVLTCLIFSSTCLAHVFTPTPEDKSLEYLGTIFQIGNITGTAPAWMRGLFAKFNTVVLTLGVSLLAYIYLVSTVNTAQEGSFMGKKYSSAWIPLRSVFGIAILIPTPTTGYSLIQYIVIWIVTNGVGAADHLWEYIVQHMGTGTGKVNIIESKTIPLKASKDLTESLLRTAVCTAACHRYANAVIHQITLHKTANNGVVNFGIPGAHGLHNVCGSYEITGNSELQAHASTLYKDKLEALSNMYSELLGIAEKIIAGHVVPKDQYGRLSAAEIKTHGLYDRFIPAGYVSRALHIYSEHLSKNFIPKSNTDIRDIQLSATARGWISAGEYYYLLNKGSDQALSPDASNAPVAIAGTVPTAANMGKLKDLFRLHESGFINTKDSLHDAEQYFMGDSKHLEKVATINVCTNRTNNADSCTGNNLVDEIISLGNDKDLGQYIQPFTEQIKEIFSVSWNKDPLLTLSKFGDSIMTEIENSWRDILVKIIESVKDKSKTEIPEVSITVIVTAILMTVWGFAAALAVYLPAVPYIVFALGALGWMLLVVEAAIAAPILALGFIAPSQDELGKTIPGLMLLLNILLRPSLMLIGFLMSALCLKAAMMLLNGGMLGAMYAFREVSTSLTGPVIMLFVYVGIVVAITNKCFSLIYILPDKILRWVGSTGEDTGQAIHQIMSETKGSFDKGSGAFGEFTKGITEAAGSDGIRVADMWKKGSALAG